MGSTQTKHVLSPGSVQMAQLPMMGAKAEAMPEVASGTEAWQVDPTGPCKPRDPTLVSTTPRSRGTVLLGFPKAFPERLEGCEEL